LFARPGTGCQVREAQTCEDERVADDLRRVGPTLSPMSEGRSRMSFGPDPAFAGAAEGIRTPDPRITNTKRIVLRRYFGGAGVPYSLNFSIG
jgi:hypothetical protein